MRGSGGSPGGLGLFTLGMVLLVAGVWLFLDSVRATTVPQGLISGFLGGGRGGLWETTSRGVVFVPFLLGVFVLFASSRLRVGWTLFWIGLAFIVVEILSRIQFLMSTKLTHLLLMLAMIVAGLGLVLRSFRDAGEPVEAGAGEESG